MIERIIGASARNLMLVLIGTAFVVVAELDALPDLSDTQVIVYTEYPGQAPQVVEDQVTYPLASAMLTVPKSRVVRGFSYFGVSFIYVIFEDGTDIYWARSRVLEYLNAAARGLPSGVTPSLGPDATGVGWVYEYALIAKERSLAELRSLQDWSLRYGLSKAEGVAEIASVGGFVKQYNVVIDPQRLRSFDIPLSKARSAIRASNMDFGGRTVELSEFEFVVRGRGYLKGIPDLRKIVLKNDGGTPVLLEDVARIELGPDERRGLTELNGDGEVASGIVLQRFGANALEVIDNVKNRLSELAGSLPKGVDIQTVYDRSALIRAAIENLRHTLLEEGLIVALVCFLFLLHVRSALVAILMLPVGVLMAFAAMKALGLGSNIMSLGGIAIAIGAMVDAAIVMIENAHKHLERAQPGTPRVQILIAAASEVGPALFFSLLIITVSFLPIFSLEAQEGRLFKPLAYTKTFSMAAAALLSVILVPALMIVFVRGRIIPEQKNPLNRFLIWLYRPMSCGRHFRLQRWSALYCSPCARPTIFPVSRATTTPVNILRRLFAPSVSVMIWPRSIRPISTSILSYRCSTPKKSICPATNVPSLRFAHWSAQCNGADASRLATPPTGTMMLPMLAGAADVAYNYTLFDTSWSFVDGTPYETDAERRQHESDENFRWRLGNYMRSIGAGW